MTRFGHCRGLVWLVSGLLLLSACRPGREPFPERIPIGEVQGRVLPGDSGRLHRSPRLGETVTLRGAVHQVIRWQAEAGHSLYGMMIQDLPNESDGDPLSSDGLFVYLGGRPELARPDQYRQHVRPGDVVTLRGTVSERFGQTELSGATLLAHTGGGEVDRLVPPTPLRLSADLEETLRILERHEGMRVKLLPGAAAVSGSFARDRNRDYQVWVAPADHPILQRPRAAERRLFRRAHVLSGLPEDGGPDGHGMRLLLGSLGLLGDNGGGFLPAVTTGAVFPEPLVGGLQYAFGQYVLQLQDPPKVREGPPPAAWRIPPTPGEEPRLRIATYNIENLYDYVNNPFHDCDFPGDPGCPGVREPWHYLPLSDAHYRTQLQIVARQIVGEMDSPHLLLLQEIENQDIGVMTPEGMVYGNREDADGALDVLQELIREITALGGPLYLSAANRNSGDARGIVTAFLYQPAYFTPLLPDDNHPVLGAHSEWDLPGIPMPMVSETANPKSFNFSYTGEPDGEMVSEIFSRAVQVFAVEDWKGRRFWLLNNHFSSGPTRRVDRRRWQARVTSRIAQRILALYPDDGVIVGGDLNMFPRPDDPLDPPSDQLGPLYRAGLFNVVDWIMARDPANAYSYVFQGEANVLDHLFLCPGLAPRLLWASYLHLNADYPESFRDELPVRGSDHDPLLIELAW